MKKSLITVILLCLCLCASAQQKTVIVKLNSGVKITGVLKDIDPTSGVVLTIAGMDKTISMSDIAEIKEVENSGERKTATENKPTPTRDNPIIVTDMAKYPETKIVRIGSQDVEFILVRGGTFLMGYDGRNSLSMNSEPIHKVNLSSYYISKECVNNRIAYDLGFSASNEYGYPTSVEKHGNKAYICFNNKTFDQFIEKLKAYSPVRVCTDAQWEYAMRQPKLGLEYVKRSYEACSDLFVKRLSDAEATDPEMTVSEDSRHVVRKYSADEWRFIRFHYFDVRCCIRLAIPAKDIDKL